LRADRTTRLMFAVLAFASSACRQDMHDQPKYKPLRHSHFFADGRDSRPRVAGTVARGEFIRESAVQSGRDGKTYVETIPVPVTDSLLRRGQERYDIFCSVCHDRVGNGGGMIVQRGYKRPSSFHVPRLREMADGYFFDVMTNGYSVMPSYASQVSVEDRWAITAYIRALQLSQAATLADVPATERAKLE
jgi:mono/diheme cytochrome c family protein